MQPVKIALLVAYDGTLFDGWQDNLNNNSIEAHLKRAFFSLYQADIALDAASRTDKGVHALHQVVIATIDEAKIPIKKLAHALNAKLNDSIRIKDVKLVESSFHPSVQAKKKTYLYQVNLSPTCLPFDQNRCWHIPQKLNVDAIKDVLKFFIGKKDFSSFSNTKELKDKDPICEIFDLKLHHRDLFIDFEIIGDRFLYKMCRTIVGTLVDVGRGKIPKEAVPMLFESKNRSQSGMTAPASGLFLKHIDYSPHQDLFNI